MLRTMLTALALLLAQTAIASSTLEEIQQKGTLTVALYKDYPPYSYLEKGRMHGIDVAIANALAQQLEVNLSIMPLTASDEAMEDDLRNAIWKGHYLGGGTADVMLHVPVDEGFAKANDRVAIFAPYFQEHYYLAHNRSLIASLDNLANIAQIQLGVELESFPDQYFTRALGGRLVNSLVHYRYIEQLCQGLLEAEVPAIAATRAQLEHCIGERSEFAIVAIPAQGVRLFSWPVGLAVKAGNEALQNRLAEAMAALQKNGTLAELFAQHGLTYTPPAGS